MIVSIDEMTQQNAALVEEAAAAAESLQDQAEQLNLALKVFKLSAVVQAGTQQQRRAPTTSSGVHAVTHEHRAAVIAGV